MHNTISVLPAEETLTHIETLLESIYDQIQAIRDERSQEQIWAKQIKKEIRLARTEIESGSFTDIETRNELVDHFDSLTEKANAKTPHHKAI